MSSLGSLPEPGPKGKTVKLAHTTCEEESIGPAKPMLADNLAGIRGIHGIKGRKDPSLTEQVPTTSVTMGPQ